MWGGHTESGVKTIIPCRATAKVTVRLVEGMSARATMQKVIAHAEEVAKRRGGRLTWRYVGANDNAPADERHEMEAAAALSADGARITPAHKTLMSDADAAKIPGGLPALGTPAFATTMQSTLSQAISATMTRAYGGVAPVFFQTGATVPAMTLLTESVMGGAADRVGSLGCSLPEHRVHSPDEYVRVEAFSTCHFAIVDLLFGIAHRDKEGRKKDEL